MPILDKPLKEDKNKRYILHAILFKKEFYGFNDALNWLKYHKFNYIHHRQTKNIWRFRIKDEVKGYNFFTLDLKNGVEMVYLIKPNIEK